MVPAGMKKVISYMVIKNLVDVIVSTGANMYHDVVEALGGYHYLGSVDVDDRVLYEHSIDRIYDVFADEKKYRDVDNEIMALADEAAKSCTVMSSRRFLSLLGDYVDHTRSTGDKEGSGLTPLSIDAIRDNYEIFQIKKASKKSGVIYVGGGVPKNYIQQTAYLQDLFGVPDSGHDYGVQLTTDRPEWGGLSGATFKEGLSWGKERPQGMYATCYCDATISLPIMVKAALETLPSNSTRTMRLNFQFDS
jgi:deoxyhypusine synthase